MTHPLKAFIEKTGTSQSKLAAAVGISRGYMSELVGGSKVPSLDLAFALQSATDGMVPAEVWVTKPKQKGVA